MAKASWTVRVQAEDGTHTLGRFTTFPKALAKAKEWLGDCHAGWRTPYAAVSMYGGVVMIGGNDDARSSMSDADKEILAAHREAEFGWMRTAAADAAAIKQEPERFDAMTGPM